MKKKLLSFVLANVVAMGTMFAFGCSTQQTLNIVNDIEKFLPAVTNIATAACAFVQNPVCVTGTAAVTASAQVAIAELQKYLQAVQNGTATPTMWDFLNTAMTQFENDAAAIFGIVGGVPANVQGEIVALLAAAQTLLAIIETLVPTSPVAKGMAPRFSASLPAGQFSLNSWVGSYNGKVKSCQKVLPSNAKLKQIHLHNVVLRVVSFGGLK